ncbi:MAG: bifunctional oligoribonuclease/PAP phosphatase NrnA [Erysipelotrichaceae bacterium]|nr:bifunctional oligoribonuclease/PAP phosphatase NrnA [Erysipelotrichaceae bacterium]
MYKDLLKKIKEYKNICIYRHIRPDGDSVFSQFALATFIRDNFKDKRVEMCGSQEYDLLPYKNSVDEDFLKNSLVICVDTASCGRVDDLSYEKGDYIIKIDHHPETDPYGDINIVDDKCSSTTELLAKIFYSKEFKGLKISKDVCIYLYSGILTDSNCFSTSSTSSDTLFYASKLTKDGGFDISALNNYLFDLDIKKYNSISSLRNELKIKKGVGYIIADKNTLKKLKMDVNDAKNAIDEFNHIKGLKIWSIFAYNAKTGLFDVSVRSNSRYTINTLCTKFNGGGHKNACGVKNLTLSQVKLLIKGLIEIAGKN